MKAGRHWRSLGYQRCQHPQPHTCWGVLWRCTSCRKVQCCENGCADDKPDLCDACWASTQNEGAKP